jgi:hypothetical protein
MGGSEPGGHPSRWESLNNQLQAGVQVAPVFNLNLWQRTACPVSS